MTTDLPTTWIPELFAFLWNELKAPELRARMLNAQAPWSKEEEAPEVREVLVRILRDHPTAGVPFEIVAYLGGAGSIDEKECGIPPSAPERRAFLVMHCIDESFELIHPRYRRDARSSRDLPAQGLSLIRNAEIEHGCYFPTPRHGGEGLGFVVPKGPLRHGAPDASESHPTGLEDFFEHLAVFDWIDAASRAELSLVRATRLLDVAPAEELRIGFVPLAEKAGDLSFEVRRVDEGQPILRVAPTNQNRLADRAYEAIRRLNENEATIAVFPELCVDQVIRDSIQQALRDASDASLHLVVAGSGIEGAHSNPPGYNECFVFDGSGELIWSQRKVNLYHMKAARLREMGISPASDDDHCEAAVPGEHLTVVHFDELGRLAILICEDLAKPEPRDSLCLKLSPDWVVAPVLDFSVNENWPSIEAWTLARKSGSRVIVANSMTMEARRRGARPDADPAIGIGVMVDDERPRRLRVVSCPGDVDTSPVVMIEPWTPETWDVATFSVRPAERADSPEAAE